MRQIRIEEIEAVIRLLKNSCIRVNRNELDINMKFEGEFIVVEENDLVKIFSKCPDTIKKRLNRMGYKTRHSCGKWYFAIEKKVDENDERVDDSSLDLKNLEEEMNQLEDDIKKSGYRSGDKLCRLLNLRKIYSIRKGDKESLFLDDSLIEQFKFCRLSKYEEIRLGFGLLFENMKLLE